MRYVVLINYYVIYKDFEFEQNLHKKWNNYYISSVFGGRLELIFVY